MGSGRDNLNTHPLVSLQSQDLCCWLNYITHCHALYTTLVAGHDGVHYTCGRSLQCIPHFVVVNYGVHHTLGVILYSVHHTLLLVYITLQTVTLYTTPLGVVHYSVHHFCGNSGYWCVLQFTEVLKNRCSTEWS